MNAEAEDFALKLADHLTGIPISPPIIEEIDLERILRKSIRDFTAKYLNLQSSELSSVVYSHGDTPQEKPYWSQSKPHQNVLVYGCPNSCDIFIKHGRIGTLSIEVKLSKARGTRASSLPGDLQRSVGQCVIASLRHQHSICFIGVQRDLREKDGDVRNDLKEMLWEKHGIALVVRRVP